MQESELLERLTPEARKALDFAHEEAQSFNHNYIGTEHLLLGLVRLEEGVATTVLQNLGVELNRVRSAVEFIIGRGDRLVLGSRVLTPRSKKVIQLALDEATRMQQERVAPEHLLLGLVREGEGIAAGVLESLGVSMPKVRQETYRVLGLPLPAEEPDEAPRLIGSQQHIDLRSFSFIPDPPGPAISSMALGISFLHRRRPWHIDAEQPQKTPVGTGASPEPIPHVEQGIAPGTLLGWVVVNTGGAFTLTLYDGLADDAPSLAVIHHPPTGACFPFHSLIKQGLSYTLEGTPGSVTIIYAEDAGG